MATTAVLTASDIRSARTRRRRRARLIIALLVAGATMLFVASLCLGERLFTPAEVLQVLFGQRVEGAFPISQLRLPRAIIAALAGIAFGMAGVTFQTMLRNPLASPDIIGITSGASAAAVFGITVLGVGGSMVSLLAVAAGLGTALAIYLLSSDGGRTGARLVLIGIGVGAMLDAVVGWMLLRAGQWDMAEAMRWLTGSLGSAFWPDVPPLAISMVVLVPAILAITRRLDILQLGDDAATAIGVPVARTRITLILVAVALAGVATATTGPIAFVAFLAGPIAFRLVGGGANLLVPAGLMGAVIVLGADLISQHIMPVAYPVGVVTGMIGAPYLIYLLIRTNRRGASL